MRLLWFIPLLFMACGQEYKVNVEVVPPGAGEVMMEPDRFVRGLYEPGEMVRLTVDTNRGYRFYAWHGYITSIESQVEFEMPAHDVDFMALFKEEK